MIPVQERSQSLQYYYNNVRHTKPIFKLTKICGECGTPFKPKKSNYKYCSLECGRKVENRSKHAKEKALPHRILKEGVAKHLVGSMFNWQCNHCGQDTPYGTPVHQLNAPEIDHIIPLSKGGHHKYDNVQLLCRLCNIRKSDT